MKAAPRSFFVFLLLQALLLANAVLTRERQRPRQPSGRKDVALKAAVALAESTCKGKPMDLVFIIDSSRSVRPNDYEKMKEFLYSMLTFLDIGPDVTRVGLVQYGSTVNNEFSLKTYNKKADIEKAIREMIHLATGTMTGLALQYTMNVAFTEEEGARPLELNVPRVAMIVTDGRPQDTVDEIAARTRNSGIVIFAVGVGRVDINTLKAMGSRPYEDHVFLVANFSQIEKLPTLFQSKLCDADICSVVDHGCAHICVSSAESYVCKCRTGYTLNPDQKTCSSQDLCAVENHGCEHLCVNVPGSYICQCREGYKLNEDRKTCSRTDFCALGDHGCEHFCVDTEDSYVCQCRQGFTLNPDGRTCSRLDYCALEIHGCEHECVNTEDSYFCRCYSGFVLNPDKKTCRKIDYCALGNHGCEHDCVNTEESFVCTCRAGFLLNPDGKTCTITTETGYCALNNHGCEHNCVNTEESFICTCCSGFILNPDGKTCKQLGYCALGNHGCEHNCINTEDFYVCSCRTGFILNPDGKTCRSKDICNTIDHGCEHVCVNIENGFACKCFEGYILGEDGKSCKRCAEGVLDLVFVIDGSKSLGAHNFEVVKQFITGIVDSLEISPNAARVGVVQYSTKVHTEFTLGSYISGKDVKEAVSQIKYMGKGSMTGHALKHMYENSFTDAEGARLPSSKVPKAVIVFTDGRAQDDVSEWANKAKKDGITMYAIGVGKAIEEELREIASEPQEKHVYYAEDFSSMSDIAEKLKTRICEEKPSGEEQCKCENLVAFQDFANKEVRKLTQRLAEMASRLEALEKNIEFK
ncbi:matrilin-2 isoform X2 [Latimeria chalumnae]|uniref:matrilin-2 isoform X2 n=1 Tax=Latimeria chalumnae TaxID=7897 RepID=UPI0006D925E6|nr:PREDICTED: matrilin-2 isoform X2 [Latimeria chalumnae]|eukprot:XP_014346940.1 PREDICTED: matrilin-2 isoform X2 [Latimeria chalumnae]